MTIHVSRGAGEWIAAHYVDGSPSPDHVLSFGSHLVATPFTLATPIEMVIRTLEMLNPGSTVVAS